MALRNPFDEKRKEQRVTELLKEVAELKNENEKLKRDLSAERMMGDALKAVVKGREKQIEDLVALLQANHKALDALQRTNIGDALQQTLEMLKKYETPQVESHLQDIMDTIRKEWSSSFKAVVGSDGCIKICYMSPFQNSSKSEVVGIIYPDNTAVVNSLIGSSYPPLVALIKQYNLELLTADGQNS